MITKHLSVIVYIIGIFVCSAQENNFIRGKILDKETKEPVVFATVRILGMAKGVVTNMDGSFRLPMDFRENGKSIEISSMGYFKKKFELQKLSPKSVNIIYLEAGVLNLSEAIVSAKRKREPSARQIVRRAIENIPVNYPNHNFSTLGYYRDYQLDSIGYTNLNEAILEIFDRGFNEIDTATTKVLIYYYIQNGGFRRDTVSDNPYNYRKRDKVIDNAFIPGYDGNELSILRVHDPIRNFRINSFDFINNIEEGDLVKNHSFERLTDTYLDGDHLYTIKMKRKYPGYSALGKLYIGKSNFAIYKLDYALYDDSKANSDSILRKQGIKGKTLLKVSIEYKIGDSEKMYPNYISLNNTFQLKIAPKFKVDETIVSARDNAFILTFNNKLESDNSVEDLSKYQFWYKNKKIHLRKVRRMDEYTIWAYPELNSKQLNDMYNRLLVMDRKRQDIGSVFWYRISDIRDSDGNLLNSWTTNDYIQFREYFVQEIKPSIGQQKDSLFMKKDRPLFEDQPINKPDNFKDYWMNTPLPKLSN